MNMLKPGSRSNCIHSPRAASKWRSSKKWWAWCFDLWHQGITETDAVSAPAFCREVWLLQSAITVLNRSCEAQLRIRISGVPGCPEHAEFIFVLISGQKGKTILKIMYFDAFLICFALYHWVLIMDRSSALNCLSSKWSYRTPTPPIIASFSRL